MLGIRFIGTDGPIGAPAFRVFRQGPPDDAWIMENTAALPRFQVYSRHMTVASVDDAIDTMAAWKKPTLVIENPPGTAHQAEMADANADSSTPPMTFTVRQAETTSYRVDISAERPGWFFLADANYPGWKATLDGKDTPLFSAQVLGKAVAIPAGNHILAITFRSTSFTWGLWISLISAVLSLLALLYERRRRSSGIGGARGTA